MQVGCSVCPVPISDSSASASILNSSVVSRTCQLCYSSASFYHVESWSQGSHHIPAAPTRRHELLTPGPPLIVNADLLETISSRLGLSLPPNSRRTCSKPAMATSLRLPFAFLAALLLLLLSSSARAEEEEAVLTLDAGNFSEVVAEHQFVVVEFYAP